MSRTTGDRPLSGLENLGDLDLGTGVEVPQLQTSHLALRSRTTPVRRTGVWRDRVLTRRVARDTSRTRYDGRRDRRPGTVGRVPGVPVEENDRNREDDKLRGRN